MKKIIVSTILSGLFVICGNTGFTKEVATLEKLPQSSYSKLCFQGKCALYDNFDNEIVTDLQYDDIVYITDTPYLKVKVNGKWALYYLYTDQELTLPIYDDIADLKINGHKYIGVKQHSKWAIFYTSTNQVVTGFIYDDFKPVETGGWNDCIYKVRSFDKYGFIKFNFFNIDKTDFEFVPAIYDDAEKLNTSNYKVKEQGKWAIYDTTKKKTASLFNYDDIKYNGTEFFGLENGEWNIIPLEK